MTINGFDVGLDRLVLGLFTGMMYGLLAVGIVLVYRSSRFINFAAGSIGAFGAAVLGLLVTQHGVPYWVAFPLAVLSGALVGAVTEAGVVRRLHNRPRVIGMVATLGLGQFIVVFALIINSEGVSGSTFPRPPFLPEFTIGQLPVSTPYVAMLIFAPIALVVIALFLRRSRYGLAIRAAADDPDGATLEGVNTPRMSTLTWAIAGGIAAMSAIFVTPMQGVQSIESIGPDLLVKGLAGAVLARMTSLPIAFVASLGIGVVEQVLLSKPDSAGLVDVALLLIILVGLLTQPRLGRRDTEDGGWLRLGAPPVPRAWKQVWLVRNLSRLTTGLLVIVGVALAYLVSNQHASVLTSVIGFTLVGLSVTLVTGIGGQLSLGQFAYAGIAGAVSAHFAQDSGSFVVGIAAGCAAAALASVIIGLPALRLRGLALAATTLAFALSTSSWLLRTEWFLGSGASPPKPAWGGYVLDLSKDYYLAALLIAVVAYWLVANLRDSGFTRLWIALRDNEEAARALAVRSTLRKLQLYALSGALAGLGGVVIGHSQSTLTVNSFPASASIDVVAIAVVGGLGLLSGPLFGALLIVGIPGFIALDVVGQAVLTLTWLVIVIAMPRGLGGLAVSLRDVVCRALVRRSGIDPDAADVREEVAVPRGEVDLVTLSEVAPRRPRRGHAEHILTVEGVSRSFGGVRAVRSVSLDVPTGDVLGIIGPNGAGKTTLFEMIAGFTKPDTGAVLLDGADVTGLSPEGRARRGLARSFQNAKLFPTMTVHETVMLAAEHAASSNLWSALVGDRRPDRLQAVVADTMLDLMNLSDVRDQQAGELATGTRRIVELTALLAQSPRVLLLDEPSAGLTQHEGHELADLLRRVNDELDVTMVVIEHDLPLLSGLADRMLAMDLGSVIAEGTPDEVRAHPEVVRSYLGDDQVAIERSGPARGPALVPTPDQDPAVASTALTPPVRS